MFGAVIRGGGQLAGRCWPTVAREFSPRLEVCGAARDRARSERPRAPVRRRADDCGGAAAHGRRSRAARARGDRRHAHGRAPARPPPRGRHRHRAGRRSGRARAVAARAARGAFRLPIPNSQLPSAPRRTTMNSWRRCAGGGCARWVSSRRCRPTRWRRAWGRRAWRGSGWRAARIRGRWCRRVPEERFEQALDLEWPIEGLEPLSFVLGRLMEPLVGAPRAARSRRGRAARAAAPGDARPCTSGRCSCRRRCATRARCARWRCSTSNRIRPPAAIDRVVVAVDPTPGRVVQFSLLTRPLPSPEQVSTLMARLTALMGEGRCGSPVAVDSWRPGAFAMKPFAPRDANAVHSHEPQRHGDTESESSR